MSDFKLCENGHYFPKGLDGCPYCPKVGSQISEDKPLPPKDFDLDKTMINLGEEDDYSQSIETHGGDLNRTQIFSNQEKPFSNNYPVEFQPTPRNLGRKLVGWLVSFTLDPLGADYRLYEGRNSIGADPGCDIVVPNDPAVSGRHLTILYRMGTFKFKDELSTNGTFINDVFEEEGNLKDGDMIKMGDTIFKFRSIA